MNCIPPDARWYIADLVLEHTIEGDPRNVVHINIHLIEADSPERAYQKANELGGTSEQEYANTDGRTVQVTFRGLRDLAVVHDTLEDGVELMYEEAVGIPQDELRKWVKPKEAMSVFSPRQTKIDGPNYLSEEVMEMMEDPGFRREDLWDA